MKYGKWHVRVGHLGREHLGGSYADLAEAERAATELRQQLHSPIPPLIE